MLKMDNICVLIKDKSELELAKKILEDNGEVTDYKRFNFYFKRNNNNWNFLKKNKTTWYIGCKENFHTQISLSDLENILKKESVELIDLKVVSKEKSSIDLLIDWLENPFIKIVSDEIIKKVKEKHYKEILEAFNMGYRDCKTDDPNFLNYQDDMDILEYPRASNYYKETFKT